MEPGDAGGNVEQCSLCKAHVFLIKSCSEVEAGSRLGQHSPMLLCSMQDSIQMKNLAPVD